MTRSTVLETLREDTCGRRGPRLAGRIVVYKHALKNAPIPVVTVRRPARDLAGRDVLEQIALPGMGHSRWAILYRDYPVVQTNVMLVAATLVSLNLLVDLTHAWLDPRIRYQ